MVNFTSQLKIITCVACFLLGTFSYSQVTGSNSTTIADDGIDPQSVNTSISMAAGVLTAASDLTITFSASHTWVGDLTATLTTPCGTTTLFARPDGGSGNNANDLVTGGNYIFNSTSAINFPSSSGGNVIHNTYLASFSGLTFPCSDISGNWTLNFSTNSGDHGRVLTLYSWSISVNQPNGTLINPGGIWSYLDDGSDQGTAWYGTGFNYASWATGNAELGYGDGDEVTTVSYGPNAGNKYPTTYFRRNFTITAADIASLKNTLVLKAIRDDGMVVYVDGVEVWKDGMPATFSYTTYSTNSIGGADESTWLTKSIPNPFTTPGTYEIGVEIHQTNATSSDISFNFEMYAINELLNADGLWNYLDNGSDQGTAWRTADVGITGANWASGNAELGFGDGDEATIVADVNQITTYFRKTITASGTDVSNSTLKISAIRDDGIVIYINGTEVLRNNMPVGTINFNTLAYADVIAAPQNFESFWNVFNVANTLVTGVNEIAVEIHQYNATSDDISFNLAFETNNDFIIVPSLKPDQDNDGREDYVDADDDNDGIPDLIEGCNTTLPASLETDGDGETAILNSLPITTGPLNDGNSITYSINNPTNLTQLNAYDAGEHGYGLRVKGSATNAQLTLDFSTPVSNLFFKLIDFDEGENFKIDVYDEFNNIVDLSTEEGIYHLGSYIEYLGSNTINEIYNAASPNTNNPENRADDIYGGAYFYFPSINVSKVTFTINYTSGGTVRIVGVQYCSKDTDGDGVDDFYDSDSDNDGIPDLVEVGGTDTDGDGMVDNFTDVDGDGITAIYDTDDNTYYIEETGTLTNFDFDGDGINNQLDLDSDNDGIVDIREAGGTDSNNDGLIDSFVDSDGDGYHDSFDGAGSLLITGSDTDNDGEPNSYPFDNPDSTGKPNFLDIDSDDDGITDHTEAQSTTATYINYTGVDTDEDGILDVNDNFVGFAGNGFTPVDTDADGTPDYLDTNSDNHGEDDILEGHDINGDGTVNSSDWGTCLNSITSNLGALSSADTDGDGLDDGFDNDLVTYDPSNSNIEPTSHPNIDDIATTERDWREPDQEYNVIDFDGFNDYIDFADNHNLTSSFTIEAWIKQDATSTGNGLVVSKRDCNKGTNLGYSFGLENHYPNVKWYDNTGTLIFDLTSAYTIGTDRWYSISITYDIATTTAKIYIDGIEVASNITVPAPPSSTNESLLVGAKYDDTDLSQKLSNEFKGWIDEIRLWNVALTPNQIRTMMNQEIQQNGTAVQGKILPTNVSGLNWTDLLGYYPMNTIVSGNLIDESANAKDGRIRNILTAQPQTSPLPYTTQTDGDWRDITATTPWTFGNTVWSYPNTVGIDGSTLIDWNIVVTSHNVEINDDTTVFGLIVNSNTLQVNGTSNLTTGNGTGNALYVTDYLKLQGKIDLEGESQLIQSQGSYLDPASSGTLEKEQQGTADTYTYNYWSMPVGLSNNTTNNNSYTLPDVLTGINFLTSGYNGSSSPVGIADYWIWKFSNQLNDNYGSWQHMRSTGTILVGEGFTMKGPGTGPISSFQNYVFEGKPNNGDINLTISAGNSYLVGNPYPSAIDAHEFITDNGPVINGADVGPTINGTLYFWEHWGGGSHNLGEYQGGYATYTLAGGVSSAAVGTNDPDVGTGGTPTKIPGRYIPVGQGFFVTAENAGTIQFNNSQRVFQVEEGTNSVFTKSENTKNKKSVSNKTGNADTRLKLRIGFNSVNTIRRQLLVTADSKASQDYDWGYDAPYLDDQMDDMYWMINNDKYVIQGIDAINEATIIPLGIHTKDDGLNSIALDKVENAPDALNVYLHDKALNSYHNLKENNYEVYLLAGEYLDRFEITFSDASILHIEDFNNQSLYVYFSNEKESIIIHNPLLLNIESMEMHNILGQSIFESNTSSNKNYLEHGLHQIKTGVYSIKMTTHKGIISKKVLVE